MHHPTETRVVDTGDAASNVIINKRPSWVHWITVNAGALGAIGILRVYDGFDANGDLKWQIEPGYSRHHNFMPPFFCRQGVFIVCDANIASYAVGFKVHHEVKEPFKGENE